MKTRSEEEMMDLILGFAKADDRIRAVLMNGSRVNPGIPCDPFQDYDVVNFVTDVEPFKNKDYVIPYFGDTIIVEQPLIGPWPPVDVDGSYQNYNIQLMDGNRIDLSFCHIDRLEDQLKDSLIKVLLDKDNLISAQLSPDESSYFMKEPTRDLYDGCCTGFYFAIGSHIPKTIWRKQLPLLKYYIESWLRQILIMMLEWEIGIRTGWNKSIGYKGKYFETYLAPDVWDEYKQTYAGYDYNELWDSLFLFLKIFNRSARFVAESHNFKFPEETALKVANFLKHVKELPADSELIY